jgi:hypothetical protein
MRNSKHRSDYCGQTSILQAKVLSVFRKKIFLFIFREWSKSLKYQNVSWPHRNALRAASFTGLVQIQQAYNILNIRGLSFGVVARLRTGQPSSLVSNPDRSTTLYLSRTRPYRLETHQASHSMGTVGFSTRSKKLRRESDHSLPSSAVVTNEWSYSTTPYA